MEQPTITIDGTQYKVADIWWSENGEIANIGYYKDDDVETVFSHQHDLAKLLQEG